MAGSLGSRAIKMAVGALVLGGLATWGSVAAQVSEDPALALKDNLAAIVAHAENQGDMETKVGVYVKVLENGRVLFSSDGLTPMIPASNLKVVSTATALSLLGPNYRLTTELRGSLPDARGVVAGNLYLRGGGDPTITPPYNQPATQPLSRFIEELKKAGVREIAGDLVADDSIFDRHYLPDGWKEHYRLDAFSAPVAGLSLNGNMVEAILQGGGASLEPATSTVTIRTNYDNSGTTTIQRPRGQNDLLATGYPPAGEIRRQICVEDPPLFTIGAFKELLDQAQIKVRGQVRLVDTQGEAARVGDLHLYAVHFSLPLAEIIREANHESDNLFTEHLFKLAGQVNYGQGTAQTGFQACLDFFEANDLDSQDLHMVDGCGLSTLNRISPSQLVNVLDAMDRSYYRSWFKESLPHAGRGTLWGRLGGCEVRAKTGTLDHDSALSGYVLTASGQELAFSVIVNDAPIWLAVETQDKIVQTLSYF